MTSEPTPNPVPVPPEEEPEQIFPSATGVVVPDEPADTPGAGTSAPTDR